MHAVRDAGHFGYKRTLAKLRQRYVWPNMTSDVKGVMQTCIQCWRQGKGGPRHIPGNVLPKGWSGEVVAMDLFGPLPTTARGNTIILVIIDRFTRWAELIPLRRSTAENLVACLRDIWLPQLGAPGVLLSDNGPQFASEVLRLFCNNVGIRKI